MSIREILMEVIEDVSSIVREAVKRYLLTVICISDKL